MVYSSGEFKFDRVRIGKPGQFTIYDLRFQISDLRFQSQGEINRKSETVNRKCSFCGRPLRGLLLNQINQCPDVERVFVERRRSFQADA